MSKKNPREKLRRNQWRGGADAASWQDGELTVRVAEDGGEAVAQRVAAAQVRLKSGEATLRRLGARTARQRFLLRAEDARRQGCAEEGEGSPAPLLRAGAW